MAEIDAVLYLDIKSILTKLEGLSHTLYADGLPEKSEKLDDAIDTIRDIIEYDVCVIPIVVKKEDK